MHHSFTLLLNSKNVLRNAKKKHEVHWIVQLLVFIWITFVNTVSHFLCLHS